MSRIKRQVELDGWDVQRCTVQAWGGDVSDEEFGAIHRKGAK